MMMVEMILEYKMMVRMMEQSMMGHYRSSARYSLELEHCMMEHCMMEDCKMEHCSLELEHCSLGYHSLRLPLF